MKKVRVILLSALLALLSLSACAPQAASLPKLPSETGIQPYELSEEEEYLLQALGLSDTAKLFAFRAPESAVSIELTVYQLNEELDWVQTLSTGISSGTGSASMGPLNGTFGLRLADDGSMDLYFNCLGQATNQTDPVPEAQRASTRMRTFLPALQEIELDQEIPIALLAYDSGTRMEALSVEDYFAPASLGGIDLVQAVTLTFTSTAL